MKVNLKDSLLILGVLKVSYDEWFVNVEVSRGTHDIEDLSKEGYEEIPMSEPLTVKCPFPLYMKTACPTQIFTGKIVRHPETIEIL